LATTKENPLEGLGVKLFEGNSPPPLTESHQKRPDLPSTNVIALTSPLTTIVYTHPSDDELRRGVRALSC
jgi:hypothetical protein